jgi:branched-chain amino acid transport system substrate-binding protein
MIVIIDGGGFEALRQGLVRTLGGVAIVALVAGAAACNSTTKTTGSSGSTTASTCGYSIAFFGALSGPAANLGINIKQGAELAVDEYDAKHGANCVTLDPFDSQGDAKLAVGVAQKAVATKKLLGIVGPAFSAESAAADPIINEAGIPLITPSATNPILATGGTANGTPWTVFHRAVASDADQGPAAARYNTEVLKATKVFVANDQSTYGAGIAAAVQSTLGADVVGTDKTGADGQVTDFSGTINKVKASGATAIFYGGYYANAGLLRKQLTAAGWKGTLIGGDGVDDPGYIKAAGTAAAEGSVFTCPCAPAAKAGGTFDADYLAKWKVAAGTYSDVAFDAANIFLNGITAGDTTVSKMNSYVSSVDYKGVANEYKFLANGNLDPSKVIVWAFKVVNGAIVPAQAAPTS